MRLCQLHTELRPSMLKCPCKCFLLHLSLKAKINKGWDEASLLATAYHNNFHHLKLVLLSSLKPSVWYYSKWVGYCLLNDSSILPWTFLSVQNTNRWRASAILFLFLAVEKQPSVKKAIFMPTVILNIRHQRGSKGIFFHKDVCTALQQFYLDSPACTSDLKVTYIYKWLNLDDNLHYIKAFKVFSNEGLNAKTNIHLSLTYNQTH